MTFSPLTAYSVEHHGKYNPRYGVTPSRMIVHHWAGTNGGDSRLTNPNQEVSANYILYSDGTLVGQVPEEYRAWTSGSWDSDAPSITVETQNTNVGGDWPVSDAAIAKLTELAADLARRYGWGSVNVGSQIIGHRDVYATACPGPYLYARLGDIAANANAILGGAAPAPSAPVTGNIEAMAQGVIRGDYGNGSARVAALGSMYDAVQARVNDILNGVSTPAPAPAVDTSNPATVQPGDGYWHVAKRVWGGDDATVEANMNKLIDINGGVRLYAGMVLQTEYAAPAPVDNSAAEAAAKAAEEAAAAAKAQADAEAAAAAKAQADAEAAAAQAAADAKAAEEAAAKAAADAEAKAAADAKAEEERLAALEAVKKAEAVKAEAAKKLSAEEIVNTITETVTDTIENITEGINNIMDASYNGKGLTPEQYAQLQSDITAADVAGIEEVKNYNLFSKEFWNYSAERVIKTFAMATAGQLSVTSAYVVTTPESAVVFADLGWTYIVSVASISALTSLLTALSNFKDIVTIKKENNL